MRKGFLLLSIILWGLIAVIAIAAIIVGVNGGFSDMVGPGTLIKSEDIIPDNIQNIVIESSYQDVEIHKTSNSSIKVQQYGKEKTSSEELFLISTSDDDIRIYFNKTGKVNFFNFNINDRLVIEIPEGFTGNLNLETSSGDIKIENEFILENVEFKSSSGGIHINKSLTINMLIINTRSGEIYIEEDIISNDSITAETSSGNIRFYGTATAKEIKAETSSGDIRSYIAIETAERIELKSSSGGIRLEGVVKTEALQVQTSSGTVRLGVVNSQTYYLKASSGDIRVESISGKGTLETTSGDIDVSFKDPKSDIKLTSSSGSIKIMLEPSLQFTLDLETSSGSINTNFAIEKNDRGNKAHAKIGDNPVANIFVNTTSGGIRVKR